jgi:hypothetical protein
LSAERPPELEALTEALDRAQGALRIARLYGLDHPETRSHVEQAHSALLPLLEAWGSLELVADMEGLSWNRQRLRHEDENREGLGRHLYREGISSIALERGVTPDELGRMLGVLGINLSLPEHEEDTLDMLLWQAELEHVSYRALRSLREAEALSGDVDNLLSGDEDDLMGNVLGLGPGEAGRRQISRELSEDAIHRAVHGVDLETLSEDDETEEEGELEAFRVDREEEAAHREVCFRLREELRGEGPGEILVRQIMVLLRMACSDTADMPAREAVTLCERALDEIYQSSHVSALLALTEQGARLLEMPPTFDAEVMTPVERFVERAFRPMRVARMLAALTPSSPLELADLSALVAQLPDPDFAAFLAFTDELPPERRGWLLSVVGAVSIERVERWFVDPGEGSYERLARAVGLLVAAGSERAETLRRELVKHPGWPVREAALRWYMEALREEELPLVLDALLDRHPRPRAAALEALLAHPYPSVPHWLRERLQEAGFKERPGPVKVDMAVAFGRLSGDRALPILEAMLERSVGLLRRGNEPSEVDAAVAGLVALGSPAAREVLERGAMSWVPSRRSACAAGLRRLGGDK